MQSKPKSSARSLLRLAWQAARVIVMLMLTAGALFVPSQQALAAGDYTVNRADDIAPRGTGSTCITPASTDCTLREAVIKANANPGSTIRFAVSLNGMPIVLSRTGNDANANAGDLDINASTTIIGNGTSNTVVQGAENASYTGSIGDKVFGINQNGTFDSLTVSFSGLTIRYGDNTIASGDPTWAFTGGGVDVFQTGLGNQTTFTNCVISYNRSRTSYGGGLNIDQGGISGGYPVDATGSVSFSSVTFDHNQTMAAGGQVTGGALNIFGIAPVVTISASTFTNNSTPSASAGGAIYYRTINGGSLSIDNSVFSGNSSGVGGAISAYPYNAGTTVTIQNSQFTGNTSSDVGGALSLEGGLLTTTPFQLTNLLVSGNTASIHGGGIYVGNAKVTLANSRIVNNTATSDASSKGLYKDTQAATVTATNNWWGCSTGPSAAPCDTAAVASGGTLIYTPWFRDRLTAAASPLVTNQSTTLSASFLTNSAGGAVLPADLAQIIGQPVTWGTTAGALSGTQTTIQAIGAATATFQASAPGTATIYAKVDNDPTSGASSNVLSLTVNKAGTTTAITGDSPDPSLVGQAVAVSYTVTGDFGNSPTAPTGNVTVSDGIDSCTGTVAAGACNITLTTSGARTLTATYAGDTNFNGSTSAGAAHTVNALPDLTLSKSNDLGGAATLGSNWTWTLHVANGPATTPANFAAGQTILVDDLDNSGNLSYGSPSAANFTNITNSPNISCAITSNRLTCSATGAVTIGASGSFDVAFTVTPGQVGSYTNPRSAGSCAVDPDGVVAETGDANNSCNTDSVTVSAPDLTVSKSNNFGGSTTLLGQAWYWRLHVANGSAAATARFTTGQVILTDDLPDNNITYGMPFTQNDTNITNIGNVSCSITNSTLTCIATGTVVIGASGSFDVIITPTPSMIGTYTNPRSGGACKVNPNNAAPETDATNNNCNSNSVTVIAPDLSISKANNVGGAVLQTGTFNWTLTVVNTGEASALFAPGMTIIEDALDDSGGLTFGMPSVANVTNVPGSANIICGIDGGKNLACIASASPVTIGGTTGRFDVVIPVTAVSEGTYSNPRSAGVCHIDANSYAESDTSNNNCNADSVTVMPAADLAVTKTDAPDPVSAGENLSYVINLVNNGPSNAQTVSLTDPIPAGATFVSADVTSGSGWTTSAPAVGGTGNVVFTKSAMSTGEAATFQVVVRLNSNLADGSTINNTATAATATPDLFGGNDNATAATTVQTRSDLSVVKTAPPTVLIGLNFDYTITVTNNGPSDSQGVTLTDGLPPYIHFVSQSQLSGPSFTLSNAGDSVTDSISTLPAGASAVIKITASVDANTPFPVIYCNAVNLSATTSDPNDSNNSSFACSSFKLNHPPVISEGGSVGVSMSKNGIPTPFALTLHATDADLDPLTWSIQSPPSSGTASVITTTGVVSYTPNTNYAGPDSFQVQVSDGNGGTDSILVNVTVKDSTTTTLVSSLNPSVFGDTVVFTATVSPDPGGGTVSFKDGAADITGCSAVPLNSGQAACSTSALSAGTHTISADYSGYDIYNASSGTLSQRITLAPTVSAGPDQTADEGSIVSFSGSFNDPALLRPQAGELLQWDFGDGTTITGTLVPTHTFGDNSLFTVTLAVTDTDGLAGLDSLQVTVTNVAPSVNAGIYTTTLTNQPLTFAGSFSDPGWLDTHTFLWDFGDGATASGSLTPSHTFLSPGVYTVTLTVTDDDGGIGSDNTLVEVVASQVVYDPGDNPGSEWSNPLTTTSPCTSTFIGEFGNEVVTLTLKDLPAHSQATVSFDLYIIRSWDGNAINWPPDLASTLFAPEGIVGPDLWSLRVNGDTLLQTTFSNWENPGLMQAFPGSYPGGSYPAHTGASQVNTLCYDFYQYPMDATYPMSFTFDSSGDTLTVDFAALGLSAITDESWGLDNIKVTVSGAGQLLHKVYLPVIGN